MSQLPGPDPFAKWLAVLPWCLGEIFIDRTGDVSFDLRHRDDRDRHSLSVATDPNVAATIARFDDAGKYRPLKTAPNLRHGWRLTLPDVAALRLALDLFYPGRVAAFIASEHGVLAATPLRTTLGRQTGMYRVAARISDQAADRLVAGFCRSDGGCLRTILWKRDEKGTPASTLLPRTKFEPDSDQTGRGERTIPLLCQEACNLLTAEARKVVKSDAK